MALRGLYKPLSTAAVIGAGVAAIAIDQAVEDHGPGVIIEPTVATLERFRPLGEAAAERLFGADDPSPDATEDATEVAAATQEETGRESAVAAEPAAPEMEPTARQAQETQLAARCDVEGQVADVAVLGDRVALRFFEHSAIAVQGGSEEAASNSIVFERLDLSGSYEIGGDGAISLPAIGHVDVIARSLRCIEQAVVLAARERLQLDTTVSASFASRPPVLIRGTVRAPGAHAYSPGLTVERVLAQAGAISPVQQISAQQLVSLRAREKELNTLDAGLLIERARVTAALSEDATFAADHEAWDLVSQLLGESRVETEREKLLSELEEERAQQEKMQDRIAYLGRRVDASRDHLDAVERHLEHLSARYESVSDLLERGLVAESKLEEVRQQMMAMERTVHQRRDTLLQLEAELLLARNDAGLREAQRRMQLAAQARDIAKERTSLREQIRVVRAQMSVDDGGAQSFLVTIQRPGRTGSVQIAAYPDTSVRPGDLVTVAMAGGGDEAREVPLAAPEDPQSDDLVMPISWVDVATDLK